LGRLVLRLLLIVVVPGWLLARIAAEWLVSKEQLRDSRAQWLGIGFGITDLGLPVLVVLVALAWLSGRRLRRGDVLRTVSGRIVAYLAPVYLVALGVVWWAMTTKPA